MCYARIRGAGKYNLSALPAIKLIRGQPLHAKTTLSGGSEETILLFQNTSVLHLRRRKKDWGNSCSWSPKGLSEWKKEGLE